MRLHRLSVIAIPIAAIALIAFRRAPDDTSILHNLDQAYQAAVEINDVAGMDSILAPDFILVTGRGTVFTKKDLIESARRKDVIYEQQKDSKRTVRLYGNTAVVTALLWEKGTQADKAFDKTLWFSDVYVRTPNGWRYVFGQASIALPDAP